ncbi:hypothetical protein GCM10011608_59160 [Micromonospora sonchi]|uniref:Uncharacterized protein n=1 Tax=Micromonospora sonchi TaxID=1763543 RepID=A0A917U8V2_9ACTN|nr:hypothetical protein GCM10011608_59160 [Micromonospora sonchi]
MSLSIYMAARLVSAMQDLSWALLTDRADGPRGPSPLGSVESAAAGAAARLRRVGGGTGRAAGPRRAVLGR